MTLIDDHLHDQHRFHVVFDPLRRPAHSAARIVISRLKYLVGSPDSALSDHMFASIICHNFVNILWRRHAHSLFDPLWLSHRPASFGGPSTMSNGAPISLPSAKKLGVNLVASCTETLCSHNKLGLRVPVALVILNDLSRHLKFCGTPYGSSTSIGCSTACDGGVPLKYWAHDLQRFISRCTSAFRFTQYARRSS